MTDFVVDKLWWWNVDFFIDQGAESSWFKQSVCLSIIHLYFIKQV